MARTIALALGMAFLIGCGGAQPKPATPEPEPAVDEAAETGELEPVEADEPEPSAPSERVSEFGDRPPPIPEAWEPKQADCDDLRAKYEQLLLAVEMEKLDKRKLQEKYRASAEKNVRDTAKKGADNWMQACQEIIGTVQSKPRWKCAGNAASLERFNGCMDGKYDAELKDE